MKQQRLILNNKYGTITAGKPTVITKKNMADIIDRGEHIIQKLKKKETVQNETENTTQEVVL